MLNQNSIDGLPEAGGRSDFVHDPGPVAFRSIYPYPFFDLIDHRSVGRWVVSDLPAPSRYSTHFLTVVLCSNHIQLIATFVSGTRSVCDG